MGKTKPKPKPTKDKEAPVAVEVPAFLHLSKLRCPRCGVMMKAAGTRDGGRLKRWECPAPVCRRRTVTTGQPV